MARNSFVVYDDWAYLIQDFTTEEVGQLFSALLITHGERGVIDLKNVSPKVRAVYPFVWHTIMRDDAKYQKKCDQNKRNQYSGSQPVSKCQESKGADVISTETLSDKCCPPDQRRQYQDRSMAYFITA